MDGFRFDLASCLCRDGTGTPLAVPPIIRDIAQDPVLSKVRPTYGHASVHHLCKIATQLPEHLETLQCRRHQAENGTSVENLCKNMLRLH